jgi:hypothetical protein
MTAFRDRIAGVFFQSDDDGWYGHGIHARKRKQRTRMNCFPWLRIKILVLSLNVSIGNIKLKSTSEYDSKAVNRAASSTGKPLARAIAVIHAIRF